MSRKSEGLAKCPFCKDGGDPEINYSCGGSKAYVRCHGCGIFSPSFDNKKDAVAYWNTRAERTCTNSYKGGCTVAFKCSSCGDSVFYPKKGSGKHVKPKYCHNCGAKVVE